MILSHDNIQSIKTMKTLFAALFIALTVSTSALTFARPTSDPQPVEASVVVRPQAMKLDVITQGSGQEYIVIRLRDANGNTLFKKFVDPTEKATLSRFNLSNLEDGQYKVEISDGANKQVKEFTIVTTVPQVSVQRTVSLP
jgi:hypothetical protein